MINRIVLVGRLTRDPELKNTNSGLPVCSFTIAVDNRQKNQDGTRGTSFIPCTVFDNTASNMTKFLKKGALVGVEGRLTQRSFTRQDGSRASILEVICDSVQFLEPKGEGINVNKAVDNNVEVNQVPAKEEEESLDVPDDDLPW